MESDTIYHAWLIKCYENKKPPKYKSQVGDTIETCYSDAMELAKIYESIDKDKKFYLISRVTREMDIDVPWHNYLGPVKLSVIKK